MSITVELTYDLGKELGERRFELEGAQTVADVVKAARERFCARGGAGSQADRFELLTGRVGFAVNGVFVNHRRGLKTRLSDGDRVSFLKAAAGG